MSLAESRYHFVGIGGIGMSGLAELLHFLGAEVTGSDLSSNQQVKRLKEQGIEIYSEHRAENLGRADVVVYSSAIKKGHVELQEARNREIPVIPRAEALAELMRLKRGIAVAGTHGKTTTTSLLASSFIAAQQDPAVVVGGRLQILGSNAVWGRGPWMIAEADESDGSFSKLSPEVVVVTNIDNDHLDHYGSFENLKKAFFDFSSQVPFYGIVVACGDDKVVRDVFSDFPKRVKFYGIEKENDYVLQVNSSGCRVFSGEEEVASFGLQLPGKHNALNATAAIAVASELGLPMDLVSMGLEKFSGVDRRAQWKGTSVGVDVFDDYGHHPTEVQVTLEGFKEKYPDRRLVACFQPHRYSRTENCWSQFLAAFEKADEVWITDIYAAGESPIESISAERLASEISHENCRFVSREKMFEAYSTLKSGDVFITLGAGDSWKIGMEFLESGN